MGITIVSGLYIVCLACTKKYHEIICIGLYKNECNCQSLTHSNRHVRLPRIIREWICLSDHGCVQSSHYHINYMCILAFEMCSLIVNVFGF